MVNGVLIANIQNSSANFHLQNSGVYSSLEERASIELDA